MQPQLFKPTTNVTRETFNFVVDNPGCKSAEVESYISGLKMSDALILVLALGGTVAVLIYASILAWLFIQEHKDD
jgi:hypothetical protein